MKHINYITALLAAFLVNSLHAQLIMEDFESYLDTSSLQADVFSFGSAAQAGKPSLAVGLGENDSNANLSLINLSPNTQNLSGYSEVTAFIFLESNSTVSLPAEASASTIVKLAIEGVDGSIWQTRSIKAERPPVGSAYKLRFRLSPSDMELLEGSGQFQSTISNIKNIRLRFENSRRSGFRQDAYIDSITAVQ